MTFLKKIHASACQNYDDFARNIIDQGKTVDFSSYRHPEETAIDSNKMLELLERRKNQIELVIEDHLIHLHGQSNVAKFKELN